MITFVTDILSPAEPDILKGFEHYDLVFVPLDDDLSADFLRISPPETGWSHDELCCHSGRLECGDAYLAPPGIPLNIPSSQWVGSSEV